MEPFIGEVKLVPYSYAPKGWAYCDGQLLSVRQSQALFSLLGTTYGGDGVVTFGLPDLRSRLVVGTGQSQGLSPYIQGQSDGTEQVTLTIPSMPQHTHQVAVSSAPGTGPNPAGNYLAVPSVAIGNIYGGIQGNAMNGQTVGVTGNSIGHENRQPYLVLSYIIALVGVFPARG